MDRDEPARIFYDTSIDHHERRQLLEAGLSRVNDEEVRMNLRQYLDETQSKIDQGSDRWDSGESPAGARDDVIRRAIACAATDVRPHPVKGSFLEVLLE